MPKIEKSTDAERRVSLAQIDLDTNVRENYEHIDELADSIAENGLLQSLSVKDNGINPNDGMQHFLLIAGYRRFKAVTKLFEENRGPDAVNIKIVQGENLVIQLVENVQRSDLKPAELEAGIHQMIVSGMNQKDIAHRLSKSAQWVCNVLAAYDARTKAENAGIDTKGIETSAMRLMNGVKDGDIKPMVQKLQENGGTMKVADNLLKMYQKNGKVANAIIPEPFSIKTEKPLIKSPEHHGRLIDDYKPEDIEVPLPKIYAILAKYKDTLANTINKCNMRISVASTDGDTESLQEQKDALEKYMYKQDAALEIIALLSDKFKGYVERA